MTRLCNREWRRPGLAWDEAVLLHPDGCLPMEGRKGKCSEERLDTRRAGLDMWDHEGSEVHGNGERSEPTKSNLFHLVFGGSPASPWNRNTREGTDADRRSLSFPTKPMRKTIRSTQGPNSEGSEPGWIRDTRRSTHLVPERKEADPTPALVEERHRRNQGKGGGRGTTAVDEVSEGRIASTGPTTRSQRRGKKNRGYRRRRRTRVRS